MPGLIARKPTVAGDLSLLQPPLVTGLQGRPISIVGPTTYQPLVWDGNRWTPGGIISTGPLVTSNAGGGGKDGILLSNIGVINCVHHVTERTFGVSLDTDTQFRFWIDSNGLMQWGPGGAGALDVNLYRAGVGQLQTDFAIIAANGFVADVVGGNNMFRNFLLSTDANPAYRILGSGSTAWGLGGANAVDTTLIRNAAAQLKTESLVCSGANGLGYATGAGGTVTQITSRTTGVTINKTCGAITLVSAAGSATWASFVVTNSTVAATDTVVVCAKSGTNVYLTHVTAVAAGSFTISFATTGGTSTDAPVFNFAVIKAVTA